MAHGGCSLWSPCKPMNSLRPAILCKHHAVLSATGFVLELQLLPGICGPGLLVQMPLSSGICLCGFICIFSLFMKFSDSQDFTSQHDSGTQPVCVCGSFFSGICLEMHPGGGGLRGGGPRFSQFLYNAAELCSPPTAASPGGRV